MEDGGEKNGGGTKEPGRGEGNWKRLGLNPEQGPKGPLLCSSPPRCCRDCAPGSSVAWPWRGLAGRGRCPRRPAEAQVYSRAGRPALPRPWR